MSNENPKPFGWTNDADKRVGDSPQGKVFEDTLRQVSGESLPAEEKKFYASYQDLAGRLADQHQANMVRGMAKLSLGLGAGVGGYSLWKSKKVKKPVKVVVSAAGTVCLWWMNGWIDRNLG